MIGALCAASFSAPAAAATFALPQDGSTVVGHVIVVNPSADNTLLDIARHYDVGYEEIVTANPGVSVWKPGERVVVPRQFILPPKPWQGIVLNIPQRRLFYFPSTIKGQQKQVITYPVSIAKEGWSTPLGSTRLTAKYKDPSWLVPKSIQEEHLREEGVEMPEYFPPGPNNPMGMLAMRTGFPGIFIHATNRPWGVGMRTSHGCLHLYPEDAAELFPKVAIGTPVRVINEPILLGNERGRWVMASFEPVQEYGNAASLEEYAAAALSVLATQEIEADNARVQGLIAAPQSVPVALNPDEPEVGEWLATLPVQAYDYEPYGVDANNAQLPEPRPRS